MCAKLILIAGLWFNPCAVTGLKPQSDNGCLIVTGSWAQMTTEVDIPCDQVAARLNGAK